MPEYGAIQYFLSGKAGQEPTSYEWLTPKMCLFAVEWLS